MGCGNAFLSAVDSSGNTWVPDQYFSSGSTAWANTTTPPQDAPFQYLRFAPSITYTIPVTPGLYTVTLRFIEPNKTAANQRRFTVSANGQIVVPNLDLFATTGGAQKPFSYAFPVVAMSKTLTIQFTSLISGGSAVVSGIQIDDLITSSAPPDLSGYVPYTGATKDLDLGDFRALAKGFFVPSVDTTHGGRLFYLCRDLTAAPISITDDWGKDYDAVVYLDCADMMLKMLRKDGKLFSLGTPAN